MYAENLKPADTTMSKKRLSTIRKGIRYQDWIAAEAILDMLARKLDSPIWVEIENPSSGKFDDVIVGYPSKVVHRQVKWSANPGSEPLTIDDFSLTNSKRKTPLVKSYAKSWVAIRNSGQDFELEFLTNRSADSDFQKILNGSTSKIKTKLNKTQEAKLESEWRPLTSLNKTNFKNFRRIISFLVSSPSIEKQEEIVEAKLEALGGNENDLNRLLDKIEEWSMDDDVGRLTAGMVERELELATAVPNNTFQLAEFIAQRVEFHAELNRRISKTKSGYLVVLGSPGSGKSTAMNTIVASDSFEGEFDVVVYNCFTGTSDEFLRSRARHANFVAFLASELRRHGLTSQIKTGADELERLLATASKNLKANRTLVVVIDGLDYAKRYASNHQPNLVECLPPNLPKNVVFVVTAQVIEQLPIHLQSVAKKTHLLVPPLDQAKIKELVLKFGFEDGGSDEIAWSVNHASNGHALYVSYALKYLKAKAVSGVAPNQALSELPTFDDDISKYYSSIFQTTNTTLRDALGAIASCPFQLSFSEIGRLMSPSINAREVEEAFYETMHLFEAADDYLQFTHDSLRAYAIDNCLKGKLSAEVQAEFLAQLKDDPRPGEFLLPLLVETKCEVDLAQINFEWIVHQIMNGSDARLIHEGLTIAALFYLEKNDWKNAAKFWCLMACLERARNDGELNETTLIRAWLDLGQIELVKRYLFLGSRYLSVVYPSDQAIDLLEDYGHSDVAAQLRQRETTQTPPESMAVGHDFEFDEYIRNLALVAGPDEVVEVILRQQEGVRIELEGRNTSFVKILGSIEEYTRMAAENCLDAGIYSRVQAWLDCERAELGDKSRAKIFLQLHLELDDLEQFESLASILGHVDQRWLLVEVAKKDVFQDELASQFDRFYLPRLLSSDLEWHELSDGVEKKVLDLFSDAWLAKKLNKVDRLDDLRNGISGFQGRCARRLLELVFDVACLDAVSGTEWLPILTRFCDELPVLQLSGNALNDPEYEVTKASVCMIGHLIRPLVDVAAANTESDELQTTIKDKLIPTLKRCHIQYTEALWSIAETLIAAKTASPLAIELIQEIENRFVEDWSYKSGALISLAGSYAKLGEHESARRVFKLGLRASFSYVFRKDTTINEFITSFDIIVPHLEDCLPVAEFITQVLILLDTLTDKAMIFDAAAYFVVLLSKLNEDWAVEAACLFENECRSMKCRSLFQAGHDEGVDVTALAARIRERIPNVEFENADSEAHHRAYFVTSGGCGSNTLEDLKKYCEDEIADSKYCRAFWSFATIIEKLIRLGKVSEAVDVFREFQKGLEVLVDSYKLPNVSLSANQQEQISE